MYGYDNKKSEELNLIIEATHNENSYLTEEEPIGLPGYSCKDIIAAYDFNQITIEWIQRILLERNDGHPFTENEKKTLILKEYSVFRRICDSDSLLYDLLTSRIYDLEKSTQNEAFSEFIETEDIV